MSHARAASEVEQADLRLVRTALDPQHPDRDTALHHLIRRLDPVLRIRANRAIETKRGDAGLARTDVDDLMQEIWAFLFAEDFRVLRTWDPTRGRTLRSYVGMIATRFCVDLLRGRRLNPQRELASELTALERDAALVDDLEVRTLTRCFLERLVAGMRDLLSKDGQALLDVMYLEGASPAEAEARTGLPRTKIYNQRRRITMLARQLARELEGETEVGST
ncbi:MAG: hypothetical protein AAFN74_17405 [Myxococcota bacterium]